MARKNKTHRLRQFLAHALCWACLSSGTAFAQAVPSARGGVAIPDGKFVVSKNQDQMQLVINSSKLLELDQDITKSIVHNDAMIQVQPISRNQLMVSAKATGVTQIDLYDKNEVMRTVQVVVLGDARELEAVLKSEFPTANIMVRPINNAVILSGQVTSDEHVEQVVTIAEQYYPTVINKIGVVGMHTVMLHTQVLEVSRTKLRELGIDWGLGTGNDFVGQSVSGVMRAGTGFSSTGLDTFKVGVVENSTSFFTFIRALRSNNLVKVMADPTVVAIDGRPASFNSGGEFPILVPAGLGQVGVEFREFGTRLDFVAKVRGDGRIFLEVRPTISEIDTSRTVTLSGVSVPGLRSRFVDTAVELRAGQTLALAGLLQVRTETQSIGLPGLADIPYLGAAFRANREVQNEVELLITVTPDFAGPMEACEVPPGGPGYNSTNPNDREFYGKGYMEVPTNCGPGSLQVNGAACGPCGPNGTAMNGSSMNPSMSTANTSYASPAGMNAKWGNAGNAQAMVQPTANGNLAPVVPAQAYSPATPATNAVRR